MLAEMQQAHAERDVIAVVVIGFYWLIPSLAFFGSLARFLMGEAKLSPKIMLFQICHTLHCLLIFQLVAQLLLAWKLVDLYS